MTDQVLTNEQLLAAGYEAGTIHATVNAAFWYSHKSRTDCSCNICKPFDEQIARIERYAQDESLPDLSPPEIRVLESVKELTKDIIDPERLFFLIHTWWGKSQNPHLWIVIDEDWEQRVCKVEWFSSLKMYQLTLTREGGKFRSRTLDGTSDVIRAIRSLIQSYLKEDESTNDESSG